MRARLLPKLIAWLFVPCAWRIMKKMNAPMRSTGSIETSSVARMPPAALSSTAWKFTEQSAGLGVPAASQISAR